MPSNDTTTSPPPHVGSTAELGFPVQVGDAVACHLKHPIPRLLVMTIETQQSADWFNSRYTQEKTGGWWIARRPNTTDDRPSVRSI